MDNKKESLQWKQQADYYFKQKNYQQSGSCYTQAIDYDPDNEVLYRNRALCSYELGQFDIALEDIIASININEESFKSYYIMANCLSQLGRIQMNPDLVGKALVKYQKGLLVAQRDIQKNQEFIKQLNEAILRAKKLEYFIVRYNYYSQARQKYDECYQAIINDPNINDQQQQEMAQMLNELFVFDI